MTPCRKNKKFTILNILEKILTLDTPPIRPLLNSPAFKNVLPIIKFD